MVPRPDLHCGRVDLGTLRIALDEPLYWWRGMGDPPMLGFASDIRSPIRLLPQERLQQNDADRVGRPLKLPREVLDVLVVDEAIEAFGHGSPFRRRRS